MPETITVRDLDFSVSLNIGAAKWLERASSKKIVDFVKDLLALKGETFDFTMASQLLTALYIAAHPGIDPGEAEAAVDRLNFQDMLEVLNHAKPLEVEAKAPAPAPTEQSARATDTASVGQITEVE